MGIHDRYVSSQQLAACYDCREEPPDRASQSLEIREAVRALHHCPEMGCPALEPCFELILGSQQVAARAIAHERVREIERELRIGFVIGCCSDLDHRPNATTSYITIISHREARRAMQISHETAEETDRRLRRVLAMSTLDIDAERWWYQELADMDFPSWVRTDAIAVVRDGETWSQLVPVRPGDDPTEPVRIWTFHFPEGVDNSGFVGWLASHIKAATGSGVIVVCGQNSKAGGIYDHWACPETVAGAVFEMIDRLSGAGSEVAASDLASFDGLELRVMSTDAVGEVGDGARLSFRQVGPIVSASYSGGAVALGFLVGVVDGGSLVCRYVQAGTNGRVDAGHSTWELRTRPGGGVEATERFMWDTRPGSGTNTYEQVVTGTA